MIDQEALAKYMGSLIDASSQRATSAESKLYESVSAYIGGLADVLYLISKSGARLSKSGVADVISSLVRASCVIDESAHAGKPLATNNATSIAPNSPGGSA